MAVSAEYGRIALEGVAEDEPVFILPASDPHAPDVIRNYMHVVRAAGQPSDHLLAEIDRFRDWRQNNGR